MAGCFLLRFCSESFKYLFTRRHIFDIGLYQCLPTSDRFNYKQYLGYRCYPLVDGDIRCICIYSSIPSYLKYHFAMDKYYRCNNFNNFIQSGLWHLLSMACCFLLRNFSELYECLFNGHHFFNSGLYGHLCPSDIFNNKQYYNRWHGNPFLDGDYRCFGICGSIPPGNKSCFGMDQYYGSNQFNYFDKPGLRHTI